MQKFTRHITLELIKVFLVTLTGLTLFMLLIGVVQEARNQGLNAVTIVRLLPYLLPNALRFAIPGTILFAACSVFGRMAAANEIVAVKSLGLSPAIVLAPALVVAFITSILAVWMNDLAVSWGRHGVQRVIVESVEEIAYGMLRAHRRYSTRQFSLTVESLKGRILVEPMLSINAHGGSPPVKIFARYAKLSADSDAGDLYIYLTDSTFEIGKDGKEVIKWPGTMHQVIPLSDASNKSISSKGPSKCPLREIPQEIIVQNKEIENFQQSFAVEAAFDMMTGKLNSLTKSAWLGRHKQLKKNYERLYRLQTEPYRRWANGFSCLCFVFVGAPLAMRMRNADLMTTFGICFVPILLLYYPLLAFAVGRAKCGALPCYSVWLGNAILCILGAWLWRKTIRY